MMGQAVSAIHHARTSYHAGLAAEGIVEQDYQSRGSEILAHRWRGTAGEIDLVARSDDGIVFIEVKKSKSHDRALYRVSPKQINRIMQTAEEYLSTQPDGLLTPVRFDVATVDQIGSVQILENAFAA